MKQKTKKNIKIDIEVEEWINKNEKRKVENWRWKMKICGANWRPEGKKQKGKKSKINEQLSI